MNRSFFPCQRLHQLRRTTHAGLECGVYLQPSHGNRFPAPSAIAKFAITDTDQGPFNRNFPVLAAARDILGHGLLLHCVHAGQTPDALLVELDRSAVFPAFVDQPNRLDQFVFKTVREHLDDIAILDSLHGSPPDKRADKAPARPDLSGR